MSLIYNRASQESIDRAVAKAKLLHPRVKVLGYGQFEVEGRTGSYTVKFVRDEDGQFVPQCDCKAGQNDRVCYHACSVAPMFKLQARRKAEEAGLRAAYIAESRTRCKACGSYTSVSEAGLCEWCTTDELGVVRQSLIEDEAQLDEVRERIYTAEDEARDRADLFG